MCVLLAEPNFINMLTCVLSVHPSIHPSILKQCTMQVESQPGMLFLNSVSAKNDLFTRLHEDPLLLIKQNELKVGAHVLIWSGPVVACL